MTDLMTVDEVATFLRVPKGTLASWRYHGRGPRCFKYPGGKRVLYKREDVEAFLQSAEAVA